MLKKIWRFLTSMKFAILLLVVLTIACVFGSVIPQGRTLDEYLSAYGTRSGALIVGLCLDDLFHSTWFLVLTVQ
jgi:cytochrome c biogenesis protein